MNLISVIIPFYKKKNFIKKTIDSVLNQTHDNFEIIIIYDDPEKKDLEYLKNLFGENKKIKIIINNKNLGAGLSRNIGIDQSKGDYIGFLDADDIWLKNKVQTQISFMKKNNFRISHTSYKIIDQNDKFKSIRNARNFYNFKDLLKSCDIGLSTVILHKSIITDELRFPNLKTKEDFVFWLKILRSGIPIGAVDEYLTNWRKTKNSLSSSILQKLFDGYRVYRNYMKYNQLKSFYLLICLSLNFLKK